MIATISLIFGFLFSIISFTLPQNADSMDDVENLLNQWHQDAWNADQEAYFEKMSEDCIFIGTDLSEVWTKQAFFEWSKPYFSQGNVWKFTSKNRHIYFNKNKTIAWFDEEVHSSAGVWRGSGVLSHESGTWKIEQYVLSMTIPNDLMGKVIHVIKIYNDTITKH